MSSFVAGLALVVASAHAYSSGLLDVCNALSPVYGCGNFKNGDRAMCTEKGKEMDWVKKPEVDATLHDLFAGSETAKQTTYTPGEFVKVSLRTKKYDQQFRGILLYAIDAADKSADPAKVGKWEFTDTDNQFHQHCPNTVLHAGAALKPYLATWRFLPPANATIDIKFVALIKVGPANMGEFYYPNSLVLTKAGEAPTADKKWYEGANNASCAEVCAARDLDCDADKLANPSSAAKVESLITPYVTCKLPYLARCTTQGLSTDAASLCYFCDPSTAGAAAVTCASKSADKNTGRRICPCKCKAGGCATNKPAPVPSSKTPSNPPPVGNPSPSPSPSPSPGDVAVCSKQVGCVCGVNGECESGAECSSGFCAKNTCVAGALGCPCTADSSCQATFKCDGTVCARADTERCTEGDLGCPCKADSTCTATGLMCNKAASDRGVCAMNVRIEDVCQAGALGCDCNGGKCDDEAHTCKVVSFTKQICVDQRVLQVADDASSIVAAVSAIFVALAATL